MFTQVQKKIPEIRLNTKSSFCFLSNLCKNINLRAAARRRGPPPGPSSQTSRHPVARQALPRRDRPATTADIATGPSSMRHHMTNLRALLAVLVALLLPAAAAAQDYAPLDTPLQIRQVPGAPIYYSIGNPGVPGKQNQGNTSNAGFVVTSDGVVVFDALGTPSLGWALLQDDPQGHRQAGALCRAQPLSRRPHLRPAGVQGSYAGGHHRPGPRPRIQGAGRRDRRRARRPAARSAARRRWRPG